MMNGVNLVGILDPKELDVDQFPIKEQMPDGFASFMGSSLSGTYEVAGTVDAMVRLGRRTLEFTMTVDQAKDMIGAITEAVRNAEEITEEFDDGEK